MNDKDVEAFESALAARGLRGDERYVGTTVEALVVYIGPFECVVTTFTPYIRYGDERHGAQGPYLATFDGIWNEGDPIHDDLIEEMVSWVRGRADEITTALRVIEAHKQGIIKLERRYEPPPPRPASVSEDWAADLMALVRWRDDCSLDWWGEELLHHVHVTLQRFETRHVPREHQAAHRKFLYMEEERQWALVQYVVEKSEEDARIAQGLTRRHP